MARVTVEDCILQVPNRFKLVMLAAQRSRQISVGGELTVERDNDKNPVVALREIADLTVELDELHEAVVSNLQKHRDFDELLEEDEEQPDFAAFVSGDSTGVDQPKAAEAADLGEGFEDVSPDEVSENKES